MIIAYQLKAVRENFKIRLEIALVVGVWLPVLISTFVVYRLAEMEGKPFFVLAGLEDVVFFIFTATIFVTMTVSMTLPLIYAYLSSSNERVYLSTHKESKSLGAVLSSDVERSDFAAFLKSEFAIENLKFVEAIDVTLGYKDSNSFWMAVESVVCSFVKGGAPLEVNLPYSVKNAILKLIRDDADDSIAVPCETAPALF